MQFSRIVGKIDPKIINQCEENLTQVFLQLGTAPEANYFKGSLGGDPLVFALVVPTEHIATCNIPTAGTDGKRFYWNPKWLNNKSLTGIRLVCYHESGHALYMHPQRRGSRIPILWNIAIDYIVNGMAMEDLKIRLKDDQKVRECFVKHLGNYLTLPQCIEMFKNPLAPLPGLENFEPDQDTEIVPLPDPNDDRELTEKEKQELDRRAAKYTFFYADPNLSEEMKRPEKIYEVLLQALPKCPKCGRAGIFVPPDTEPCTEPDHQHGEGNCDTCCNGYDVLNQGSTIDEHIDATEDPAKMAKRISDAIRAAKQMAGRVPSGLEDELGILTAPRIRWQDSVRTQLTKIRNGNSKNDWTRFRHRPMFAGLLVPRRNGMVARAGCLLDTSGSMSREDMAFGISQLQSLDERSEITVCFCDAEPYFDKLVKLRSINASELSKLKPIGRGGSVFDTFFNEFEKRMDKQDFLIVITDGYWDPKGLKEPSIPVYWVVVAPSDFKPGFGKVFSLRD
jgi:predicted metal-dependent peptidase